ncbi:LytR/AlgR family response regulator transcription factor [Finegoldia magna]|uniref:LytR/AlgR family response regulator transcription factor n=1 Tax=Finegoldia magna TaxID=1260 RepID=UPI00399C0BD1
MFDKKALIIYVTNYESFAKEAFEVSAFRFITKPINVNKFENILSTQRGDYKNPRYFRYQYNKIPYRVPIDEIMYFQSDKRITYIITNHDSRKCYGKINDIEKKLLEVNILFYRVHQSF